MQKETYLNGQQKDDMSRCDTVLLDRSEQLMKTAGISVDSPR